jgi:ABC-type transport system substrate-binding protein
VPLCAAGVPGRSAHSVRWAEHGGDGAVLEPNAYDWGHPPWRRVPIRVIGNDASREAALLSGDLVERDLLTLQAWSRAE